MGSRRSYVIENLEKPGVSNGKGTVSKDEAARERRYDWSR
jgi:hypothetical protein